MVVGDQNPARPGVQTLLGVLGAEHPLDEEGKLGALAVGAISASVLGRMAFPSTLSGWPLPLKL
mgnify:CR=1 FL=1